MNSLKRLFSFLQKPQQASPDDSEDDILDSPCQQRFQDEEDDHQNYQRPEVQARNQTRERVIYATFDQEIDDEEMEKILQQDDALLYVKRQKLDNQKQLTDPSIESRSNHHQIQRPKSELIKATISNPSNTTNLNQQPKSILKKSLISSSKQVLQPLSSTLNENNTKKNVVVFSEVSLKDKQILNKREEKTKRKQEYPELISSNKKQIDQSGMMLDKSIIKPGEMIQIQNLESMRRQLERSDLELNKETQVTIIDTSNTSKTQLNQNDSNLIDQNDQDQPKLSELTYEQHMLMEQKVKDFQMMQKYVIIGCRVASCGHTFCNICLTECLIRRKTCPECRQEIRSFKITPNRLIDYSVKTMMHCKKIDNQIEDHNRFRDRVKNYQAWKDKHVLSYDLKAGDKIDVRDTQYIWCVALIQLKIQTPDRPPIYFIHYEGWHKKYDEYIVSNSSRLAPLGIYTARADIPRYYQCPRTNQMYGQVLENEAQLQQFRQQQQQRFQNQLLLQQQEEQEQDEDADADEEFAEDQDEEPEGQANEEQLEIIVEGQEGQRVAPVGNANILIQDQALNNQEPVPVLNQDLQEVLQPVEDHQQNSNNRDNAQQLNQINNQSAELMNQNNEMQIRINLVSALSQSQHQQLPQNLQLQNQQANSNSSSQQVQSSSEYSMMSISEIREMIRRMDEDLVNMQQEHSQNEIRLAFQPSIFNSSMLMRNPPPLERETSYLSQLQRQLHSIRQRRQQLQMEMINQSVARDGQEELQNAGSQQQIQQQQQQLIQIQSQQLNNGEPINNNGSSNSVINSGNNNSN
ncbi:UNKNOWN [Stylonychia lemnae]|uniref:RING-type domain-containing protein n=1 Tax=Stylonychia lemnae TaxID=5949 RepID=A0A078B2K6_STYLE|nr:UNKNOWN [Stylonychia lemnae]|eukprot:CDW88471.1 UNKNOWN [Stylonychia lemnae]